MKMAIIGCGNPNRRDDGVGPDVIRRLRAFDLPEGAALFDAGTDGMAVLYQARGVEHLVIIDARIPESDPGAVFDVPGDILESTPPQSINLHDFRWDHALYAGRRIYGDEFPDSVRVFLVEAESLDLGLGLSASVEAAAESLAERVATLANVTLANSAPKIEKVRA